MNWWLLIYCLTVRLTFCSDCNAARTLEAGSELSASHWSDEELPDRLVMAWETAQVSSLCLICHSISKSNTSSPPLWSLRSRLSSRSGLNWLRLNTSWAAISFWVAVLRLALSHWTTGPNTGELTVLAETGDLADLAGCSKIACLPVPPAQICRRLPSFALPRYVRSGCLPFWSSC